MIIISNPELVKDIKPSGTPLILSTNAGTQQTTIVANVGDLEKVWYNINAISNIFGLKDTVKRYRVIMGTSVEKYFNFYISKDKVIKFKSTPEGLYKYTTSENYKCKIKQQGISETIQTVEEKFSPYSTRKFERVKVTQKLYHAIGEPSAQTFKYFIRSNLIKNNPITI